MMSRWICRTKIACAVLALATLVPMSAEAKTPPEAKFWSQRGKAQGLRCVVKVNGFPIWEHATPEGGTTGGTINSHLRAGKNTVSVSLHALDKKGSAPSFSFTLQEALQTTPETKKTLLELSLGGRKKLSLPAEVTRVVTLAGGPDVHLWKEAEKLRSNKVLRREVVAFVKKLRKAVSRRKVKRLMKLSAFKADEAARAMWMPQKKMRTMFLDGYRSMLQGKGKLRLNKLDLAQIKLSLLAEGRVVYVTDAKGRHALRVEDKDTTAVIPLYLAKVKGRWQLAR